MKLIKIANRLFSSTLLVSWIFIFIVTFVNVNIAQTKNEEQQLRNRISQFYKYFADEKYDLMWEMNSKNLKKKNNNDKKGYIENLRKFKKFSLCSNIRSISFVNKKSIVSMRICVKFFKGEEWKCDTVDNEWIFEDGKWFYDS